MDQLGTLGVLDLFISSIMWIYKIVVGIFCTPHGLSNTIKNIIVKDEYLVFPYVKSGS